MSQKSPENLHDLLIVKTKALYDIEQQIVKALPKMAEAATDPDLKQGFTDHLEQTKEQVNRLEQIFKHLDISPAPETSDSIRGLISDAEWCIENIKKGPTLDAALIASGQYVEHLEMAGYGSAAEWAKTMGHEEIKNLLGRTLDEEKSTDEKLNQLAMSKINEAANTMTEEKMESDKGYAGKFQTGPI
ncbi:MAG: ferritin-like domain-containing protein [Candidatus Doudnabacteria bacterium]|nr:ferritin-like domain-containing protein [Candidatus Doudnabacteria bacterium]